MNNDWIPDPMAPLESNLVKARAAIIWILALLLAFTAVWWIESQSGKVLIAKPSASSALVPPVPEAPVLVPSSGIPATPAPRALSTQELAWARTAWAYFEKNVDTNTGLAASVAGFPATTLWDSGSYLMALLAASDLGLVEPPSFDDRLAKALQSLGNLPLYAGQLPNKSYDIRSLTMTDYANLPSEAGIGWSALDIGRLVVPLQVIAWQYPKHTDAARAVLARWNTRSLAEGGRLQGMLAAVNGQPAKLVQEGRLGYEQYAARALAPLGLDIALALDYRGQLRLQEVEGIALAVDKRDAARFGAIDAVLSEPWILMGLELGWDAQSREIAWRVYQAQEAHFRRTGILSAVTEDHVDRPPYFVYNAVYAAGKPWMTLSDKGVDAQALRTLSVKAAFGWHALLRTDYTSKLVEAVAPLQDPAQGWWAGRYDEGNAPNKALSANTNAVVLESLAYITRGRLLQLK